ncbi:hypothetical protein [Nocardioides sp.]|uniref:hypothetical protein n=1 Tax=Nocardioides sp. TaxID=35761 RepID=UPI00260B774B|nr:hypothetical protein [Nocardioides sp.]
MFAEVMKGEPRVALGIPYAIDVLGDKFDRWAIESPTPPFTRPLRCGGCEVAVGPVHGYLTRDGKARVDPLYRLAKGMRHEEGRRYDFDAQASDLQCRHVGTVTKDGDTYILVLNLASEGEVKPRREGDATSRSRAAFTRGRTPTIDQTLRAATEIVRLIRAFAHDPKARERFRARYGDLVISWDDFCFDAAHDIKRLDRALAATDPASEYPRAVVGRVEEMGADSNNNPVAHFAVRDPGDHRPVKAADDIPIKPVIRVTTNPLPETITVGNTLVAYGRWRHFSANTGRAHYVTLWLDEHRAAVARLAGD